jgi:hypothetical protein
MTLATLIPNTTIMRELFKDVFTTENFSAAALQNLKYAIAHDHLKQDLYYIFRIDSTDSSQLTNLDTIIDKYSIQFQRALMYLQCYYYFSDNDDVDGRNAKRMSMCLSNYEVLKSGWASFETTTIATTSMAMITRG